MATTCRCGNATNRDRDRDRNLNPNRDRDRDRNRNPNPSPDPDQVWEVDASGVLVLENRYCINLASVAGRLASEAEAEAAETAALQARAP